MAITSGTHNVGPGETLTTWTLAVAQISGQTLTGNVTFVQTGNITDSANIAFTGITLGTRVLKFTSAVPNYGNPNNGYSTTWLRGTNSACFNFISLTMSSGWVEIEHLYWIFTGTNGSGGIIVNSAYEIGTAGLFKIHDVLYYQNQNATPHRNIYYNDGNASLELYNAKLWSSFSNSLCMLVVFRNQSATATMKIENCTVRATGGREAFSMSAITTASANRYIRNCLAVCAGASLTDYLLGAMASSYNASSDSSATGTGSVTGITSSVFSSVSPTSSHILDLKYPVSLAQAGGAPSLSGNTAGIRGNARPGADGFYSIGADEGGVKPESAAFLPESTAKVSHARITHEHRGEQEAEFFHNYVGALSS